MLTPKMPNNAPEQTPEVAHSKQGRGLLMVMTGASGVGKGTLRERWLAGQEIFYSTSWTTRPPRPSEVHGQDYMFVTPELFEQHVRDNLFLEYAEFVGSCYGTPLIPIQQALEGGLDAVLEIEVEGAMQVKQRMPDEAVLIFIMPPSLTELRRRLTERATESLGKIEGRLRRAKEEIMAAHEFHYVIVNDDLSRAVEELRAIQEVERARRQGKTPAPEHLALAEQVRSERLSLADLRAVVEH